MPVGLLHSAVGNEDSTAPVWLNQVAFLLRQESPILYIGQPLWCPHLTESGNSRATFVLRERIKWVKFGSVALRLE